ncbi:hypothetical protein DSO57_1038113 [Entomophthora muscae]|uniref:Uncharacterized protein n=1 Tax=Entomophthora muscae TaxID=34485 RepID=A0ACC2SMS8_9FUNG|nr:hypothetical protein DSO57_1038113 [Entomophthora muscae]
MSRNIRITFAFDVLSPYSFLAHQTLSRYEKVWGVKIEYLPVSISDLFRISKNKPPAQTCANKRNYLMNDLAHAGDFHDCAFKLPSNFPTNTSLSLTALNLIKHRQPQAFDASLKNIWEAYFIRDQDISKASVLQGLLQEVRVDTADEILKDSSLEIHKAEIMKNTEMVSQKGAFGLPFFITSINGKEKGCFFGSDRITLMAYELGLPYSGPVPGRKIQSSNSKGSVIFAFDILSPYSYFAYKILRRQNWGIDIDYLPVSLVKIMKTSGNTGPTFGSENKKKYTYADLKYLPKLYDIPFKMPSKFPFDTSLLQTLLAIIKERSPSDFLPALDLLWEATFFQPEISNPEVIKKVFVPLTSNGKLKALSEWIDEASNQKSVEKYIVESTMKLVKEGAFGLPYFKVQKDSGSTPRYFFGSDRLENIAHYLQVPYESGIVSRSHDNSSKL